ncbi:MAG: hypothetical protein ACM3S0_19635 [Acidobacteriota bacterium]
MIRHFGTVLLQRTEPFLLLAPFLAGSVLFVLVPMVMTIVLSPTQLDWILSMVGLRRRWARLSKGERQVTCQRMI